MFKSQPGPELVQAIESVWAGREVGFGTKSPSLRYLQLEKLCDEALLIGNADHVARFGATVSPADLKTISVILRP